ncbi:hypothetical protein ACJX0J_039028, partial [Zea mays]
IVENVIHLILVRALTCYFEHFLLTCYFEHFLSQINYFFIWVHMFFFLCSFHVLFLSCVPNQKNCLHVSFLVFILEKAIPFIYATFQFLLTIFIIQPSMASIFSEKGYFFCDD